jgi:hypothetical protein
VKSEVPAKAQRRKGKQSRERHENKAKLKVQSTEYKAKYKALRENKTLN